MKHIRNQFVAVRILWAIMMPLLILFATGCSSRPKHLAVVDFQHRYLASRGNSVEGYTYIGQTNGVVYMLQTRVPLVFGSKPRQEIFFTETNKLPQEFLEQMRQDTKAMQNAVAQ